MYSKTKVIVSMAAVLIMPVMFQTGSFADSGKGGHATGTGMTGPTSGSEIRIAAKLVPTVGQDQTFEGHAARRTQGTRDEFEARVEVLLSALGQTDPADVHPDLVLAGAIHCAMVLDQVETVLGIAEYKVSVRSRNGVTSNRAGSCGLPGTPPAIPNVNPGDSASVTIAGETLQGTFAAKR